jgi:hypothetical protein
MALPDRPLAVSFLLSLAADIDPCSRKRLALSPRAGDRTPRQKDGSVKISGDDIIAFA